MCRMGSFDTDESRVYVFRRLDPAHMVRAMRASVFKCL